VVECSPATSVDQEGRRRDCVGRGSIDRGQGSPRSNDGALPSAFPRIRVRSESWLRDGGTSRGFGSSGSDPHSPAIVPGRGSTDASDDGDRMSEEEIEAFEADAELALYREYRDVLPMFTYVVETERRFYLANNVDVQREE